MVISGFRGLTIVVMVTDSVLNSVLWGSVKAGTKACCKVTCNSTTGGGAVVMAVVAGTVVVAGASEINKTLHYFRIWKVLQMQRVLKLYWWCTSVYNLITWDVGGRTVKCCWCSRNWLINSATGFNFKGSTTEHYLSMDIIGAPIDWVCLLITVMEFRSKDKLKLEFGLVTASFNVSTMSLPLGIGTVEVALNSSSKSTSVLGSWPRRGTGLQRVKKFIGQGQVKRWLKK